MRNATVYDVYGGRCRLLHIFCRNRGRPRFSALYPAFRTATGGNSVFVQKNNSIMQLLFILQIDTIWKNRYNLCTDYALRMPSVIAPGLLSVKNPAVCRPPDAKGTSRFAINRIKDAQHPRPVYGRGRSCFGIDSFCACAFEPVPCIAACDNGTGFFFYTFCVVKC